MSMKSMFVSLVLVLAFLLLSSHSAGASMMEKMSFDSVVGESDTVISGRVVNIEHKTLDVKGNKVPHTFVTIAIEDNLKGNVKGDVCTIKLAGGPLPEENKVYVVEGVPTFTMGEEVFLFLRNNQSLYSPVVGLNQGFFKVVTDPNTGVRTMADIYGKAVTEGFVTGAKGEKENQEINYQVFKDTVKSLIEKGK